MRRPFPLPELLFWIYPLGVLFLAFLYVVRGRRVQALATLILGIAFTPFTHALGRILVSLDREGLLAPQFLPVLYLVLQGIFLFYAGSYAVFPIPSSMLRRWVFLPIHALIAAVILGDFAFWGYELVGPFWQDRAPFAWFYPLLIALLFGEGLYRSRRLVVQRLSYTHPGVTAPIRIVFLSDLHVGKIFGKEEVEERVKLVKTLAPDLILLGGDYLTELIPQPLWEEALSPLRQLPGIAPTLAILGNHDRFAAKGLKTFLESAGIPLVEGRVETLVLKGCQVQVGGVPFSFRKGTTHEALAQLPWSTGVCLCLLHDPQHWQPELLPPGSLTFSGHLHGGQIGIEGRGFHISVLTPFRMRDAGTFTRKGRTLYVSRGAGFYGFPVRLGISNELTLCELLPPGGWNLSGR